MKLAPTYSINFSVFRLTFSNIPTSFFLPKAAIILFLNARDVLSH